MAPGIETTWQALYLSETYGVYAVMVVPALFLAYLLVRGPRPGGVEPRAAGFMYRYALAFTAETMLDPIATGPALRWLGLQSFATPVLFLFVLLGDFRVFLLVFVLRAPEALRWRAAVTAVGWTLIVPVVAWMTHRAFHIAHPMGIWLIYELAFLILALGMCARLPLPARVAPYLRAVLLYVATYYALWATADILTITAAIDAAWAFRLIPNQLYYAGFVPVAYALFFSARYAATSTSTQASR
jgi:hypothetical protein